MNSFRFHFKLCALRTWMIFFMVSQGSAAGLFPTASGDFFGETVLRCLGRTTNGTVRLTGYRSGAGGFFEFNGNSFSFTPLTPLPGPGNYAEFLSISRDGQYIAGFADAASEGVVWSSSSPGNPIGIGLLPGDNYSDAQGIASGSNGPVTIGQGYLTLPPYAWHNIIWNPIEGLTTIPDPPAHGETFLLGISADAQTIVGYSTGIQQGFDPVIHNRGLWRILDRGNFPASYDFPNAANSISHDGTLVAGYSGGRPAYWSGSNLDLHMVTMNNTNLSISWGAGIATDGGWVAGGSGGRGWIASATDGRAQYVEDWIHEHYGLVVTQSVTSVYDLLVDQGELFMVLANNAGGMLFTGTAPLPPVPAPTLAIASLPSGQIELRWPTNQSCTVEASLAITTPSVWTPLTNAVPLLTNSQFVLTLPVTNAASFYRLRCP